MGMFDYVRYEADCRKCGKPLNDFQSKSAHDQECLMRILEPKDVGDFYTNCRNCDTWNKFEVQPMEIKIIQTDKDFDL